MSNISLLLVSNMYPSEQSPYAGIYIKNIYQRLARISSFNTELLTMKRYNTGKLASALKYIYFVLKSFKYFFKKYDVVHLHFFYPLFFWPVIYKLFHPKTKIVVTFHGSDINKHSNKKVINYLFNKFIKKYDEYIGVGSELCVDLEEKFNIQPKLLSAGIDDSIFKPPSQDFEKEIDLLFVGSFTDIKGVPDLLEALRRINSAVKVVFIGVGPYYDDIVKLSSKTPHKVLVIKGMSQRKLVKMYSQSAFLIVPSRSEAFGLVASESIYCGTPVLSSNIGGLKEQVINGKNGYIFESGNIEMIKSVINNALSLDANEYKLLVDNCKSINKSFSLSYVVDKQVSIYKMLLSER